MLQQITAFFSLLFKKALKKEVMKDDLIMVATKDPRYTGGYQPTVMRVEDLLASVKPSSGGGAGMYGKYRMADFGNTLTPKTDWDETAVGKAVDDAGGFIFSFGPIFFETLSGGRVVGVYYCQTVLKNGVMIYEAYTYDGGTPDYYWLAYKMDPTDPTKLIKVGELPMTTQFIDEWYSYTYKDDDTSVRMINNTSMFNSATALYTTTTKITYTEGVGISAVDSVETYGGHTYQSLFTSLAGFSLVGSSFTNYGIEQYLDDDYYGIMNGVEAGWFYFRSTHLGHFVQQRWTIVGYNVLTGATRVLDTLAQLSLVTNFTSLGPLGLAIKDVYNTPFGLSFTLDDGDICNHGNNTLGVTKLWSPYWTNPTLTVPIYQRFLSMSQRERSCQNGYVNSWRWYYDATCFYFIELSHETMYDEGFGIHKIDTTTLQTKSYSVPYVGHHGIFDQLEDEVNYQLWSSPNGVILINNTKGSGQWGIQTIIFVSAKNDTPRILHMDAAYMSHAIGNTLWDVNTAMTYNTDRLGVAITQYENIEF